MIADFHDKETERIWKGERSRILPADIQETARRRLRYLNNARQLHDLASPPGNRLHALSGNRQGQHAIRINDQYRICFMWRETSEDAAGSAYRVEITDYH